MKCQNNSRQAENCPRKKGQKGSTLVEMLTATVVLALLAMMLHTGLLMAQKGYFQMNARAETQGLLSMVSDVLTNELRYARDVVLENGVLQRYTSASYGRNATIAVNDQGRLVSGGKAMLPSGAYGNGDQRIRSLTIGWDEAGGFQVHLKVDSRFGAATETEFFVSCLNEP